MPVRAPVRFCPRSIATENKQPQDRQSPEIGWEGQPARKLRAAASDRPGSALQPIWDEAAAGEFAVKSPGQECRTKNQHDGPHASRASSFSCHRASSKSRSEKSLASRLIYLDELQAHPFMLRETRSSEKAVSEVACPSPRRSRR